MRERSVIQEVENINETITFCQACCQETSGCREFHFNTLSQRCTLSSAVNIRPVMLGSAQRALWWMSV